MEARGGVTMTGARTTGLEGVFEKNDLHAIASYVVNYLYLANIILLFTYKILFCDIFNF